MKEFRGAEDGHGRGWLLLTALLYLVFAVVSVAHALFIIIIIAVVLITYNAATPDIMNMTIPGRVLLTPCREEKKRLGTCPVQDEIFSLG